jgi:hypothetical protein
MDRSSVVLKFCLYHSRAMLCLIILILVILATGMPADLTAKQQHVWSLHQYLTA